MRVRVGVWGLWTQGWVRGWRMYYMSKKVGSVMQITCSSVPFCRDSAAGWKMCIGEMQMEKRVIPSVYSPQVSGEFLLKFYISARCWCYKRCACFHHNGLRMVWERCNVLHPFVRYICLRVIFWSWVSIVTAEFSTRFQWKPQTKAFLCCLRLCSPAHKRPANASEGHWLIVQFSTVRLKTHF